MRGAWQVPLAMMMVGAMLVAVEARATSCSNAIKDGDETGVDCGGIACPACSTGCGCFLNSDCVSNVCVACICHAPVCNDQVKNGRETDVDCGGADCPHCNVGQDCLTLADCHSNVCTAGVCAFPPFDAGNAPDARAPGTGGATDAQAPGTGGATDAHAPGTGGATGRPGADAAVPARIDSGGPGRSGTGASSSSGGGIGAGGTHGGSGGTTANAPDAGNGAPAQDDQRSAASREPSGCGCHVGGAPGFDTHALAATVLVGSALRRRGARRRRVPSG